MLSLCIHAVPQSLSPLADCRVNDSLLQIISHFNEALLQLVDVTYKLHDIFTLYTLLHDSPDLVVDGVQIMFGGQRSGLMKSGVFRCSS